MNKKPFEELDFEEIRPMLIRFGFSFYGTPAERSPDPEKLILWVCSRFDSERKVFKMLMSIALEVKNLIHVERLKSLLENDSKPSQMKFLGLFILLSRLIETGDARFKTLIEIIRTQINPKSAELESILKVISDPFLIEKFGQDSALESLGIKAYKMSPAEKKKVLSRDQIVKNNLWLRLRLIAGTNYRADCLYLKSLGSFKTKYQIWKALGSSQETAYRICNELENLGELKSIDLKEKVIA